MVFVGEREEKMPREEASFGREEWACGMATTSIKLFEQDAERNRKSRDGSRAVVRVAFYTVYVSVLAKLHSQ